MTARGVAGAALLIGVITIVARVTGFAKQLVFAKTVGTGCLSTAYFTANSVPNLVFEIVVGGALAGMVVPVLAGAAERGDKETAGRIASALLTWVVVLLVPLSALVALLAGPIVQVFVPGALAGCDAGDVMALAAHMLAVFAPQILLYGLAVVLYGVLQAHRRFAGPALAPLVSSVVVIVAYVAFVPLGGTIEIAGLPQAAELVLSVGTTLGVLSLVLTVIWPVARLGLRWRPTLSFPPGVAPQVRRLAAAGLSALLAQQVAMAVVVRLANEGGSGRLAAFNYAWAIYLVPYAVLAVPIATSAFPVLSARFEAADHDGFAAMAARTTRAVVLVSGLAAGALFAVATPVAEVFLSVKSDVPPDQLALGIALFAPGLIGYGLMAHLSRVLYAGGHGRPAARDQVVGWIVVIAAQVTLVLTLPDAWVVGGLALGNTIGLTVAGLLLTGSVRRAYGPLEGLTRATLAAVAGGVTGAAAGWAVVWLLGTPGLWLSVLVAGLAGIVAAGFGGAVAAAIDRDDLKEVIRR
ncbi:murein biosynthesis integral membrane protein MurJ [Herbidospora mongoliensis]|uniref:murein biosynthesis integral membrane protein MurJ n=1 Tax=Herbidospora mongoliensis TaxID=688067 RepID=UPI00083743D6|nr:lipid II flippase MurJ [Herbidospora mongoliensis]